MVFYDQLARVKLPMCESSLASKATVKSFSKASRASSPLEFIHSDICESMNVQAHHGKSCFITLIGDS